MLQVSGALGCILPIDTPTHFLLRRLGICLLELNARYSDHKKHIHGVDLSTEGFVDGNFMEQFVELPHSLQVETTNSLNSKHKPTISVDDLARVFRALGSRRHASDWHAQPKPKPHMYR